MSDQKRELFQVGARNEERIKALERDIADVQGAVTEIRDKLLGRLPNWASLALTILGMMVAGLIVALVKSQ